MSSVTVGWECDPDVRVARKVMDDGVRTHIRLFHDAASIPEGASCTHQVVVPQASPELDIHDLAVDADGMDGDADLCDVSTPKADSDSESSVAADCPDDIPDKTVGRPASSHVSGSLGISQWTRYSPFPGSDAGTEFATENHIARVPESIKSYKSASHFSGTTQPPDSEGHASPHSAYFIYQESGMRTFECEDPRTVTRARGKLSIERCYATENNLCLSIKTRETFDAEVLSATPGSRFSSPAPTCQMPPPSLYLREQTPFSETNGSLAQHRGPIPE
ncbi:hypothetical protein ACEPAI_8884 [Sanghuangporus weigelae]